MHIFYIAFMILISITSIETKDTKTTTKKEKMSNPCSGKMLKNMNQEELEKMILYGKHIKDQELVFKAFYHVINITQEHGQIKIYKLDLANYCFELQDYTKAAKCFEEFCVLYPGCPEAEFVQYKLILCTFYLSLNAQKDQTDTIKTINLIAFFSAKAQDQKLIEEMQNIHKTCRQRLFEHEVHVFETYLKQQKFTGAQMRLDYIKKNFEDIDQISKYTKYLQETYEIIKNPLTRPFTFKINLKNALDEQEKKPIKKSNLAKALSFFVA